MIKRNFQKQRSLLHRVSSWCTIWMLLATLIPVLMAQEKPRKTFRSDRIIIQPREGVAEVELEKVHRGKGNRGGKKLKDLKNMQLVHLAPGKDVAKAVQEYIDSGLVEYAEPDYMVYASLVPNDPAMGQGLLWPLRNLGENGGKVDADIDATEAWNTIHSAEEIIVAVIDTGVRYTHEDLAANMWRNPKEKLNGRDDDGNGLIDDIYGINAATDSGDPLDDQGHGTHVAGIIGAVGNNGKGIAGVAWKVKIMAGKFLTATGEGSTWDAIECIDYARANGAKVINASWGGPSYSSSLERAIRNAGTAGIVFVTAAGNERTNNDITPSYPASYKLSNAVTVAATTNGDLLDSSYSNYGAGSVHLAAPGTGILSTLHNSDNAYGVLSGTSMATPHVAGAVALLRAAYASETPSQIVGRLLKGTDKLASLSGKCVTGGRLNVAALFPRSWEVAVKAKGMGSVGAVPNQTIFAEGSSLTVTATPQPGYVFEGWSGDVISSANPLEITVVSDTTVIANFAPAPASATGAPVAVPTLRADGKMVLSFPDLNSLVIETSADLKNWTTYQPTTTLKTTSSTEVVLSVDSSARFFRTVRK